MCLVWKLDNGKVVSIANGQTHRGTQPSSTVLVYRYEMLERWACMGCRTCSHGTLSTYKVPVFVAVENGQALALERVPHVHCVVVVAREQQAS